MMGARWTLFHSTVGTYGKTLIFLLLPVIAAILFLFFFKKLKYYGAALILSTHFMVYNLCFFMLHALINQAPRYINENLGGWMMKPFFYVFYNNVTSPISNFIFGSKFEFMHFIFWMPWLFIGLPVCSYAYSIRICRKSFTRSVGIFLQGFILKRHFFSPK